MQFEFEEFKGKLSEIEEEIKKQVAERLAKYDLTLVSRENLEVLELTTCSSDVYSPGCNMLDSNNVNIVVC